MIIEAEPLALEQQMTLGLCIRPGTPGEGRDGLPKNEVDPLNKGSVNEWKESNFP